MDEGYGGTSAGKSPRWAFNELAQRAKHIKGWRLFGKGVHVLIADIPTHNGKDRKDVMIRQIREAIAEENRKDIIERLWKGRQEWVRRGLPPGGNVPYGYRRNGAGLIPHEEEAAVVRRIFELAVRGNTKSAIAKVLEAEGPMRRNGKVWTRRQVSALLARAPLYRDRFIRYGEVEAWQPELILLGSSTDERS